MKQPQVLTHDVEAAQGMQECCLGIQARGNRLIQALERISECGEGLSSAGTTIVDSLLSGGRVLVAGNGGSASQAQHFAGELVGRFLRERSPYSAIALVADTTILTAVGNDYGYEEVFARQVVAYGRPGDVLLALSTSGNSRNLLRAAEEAIRNNIQVISLTSHRPSPLAELSHIAIQVPASETPTIQEVHLLMIHHIADHVERALANRFDAWEARS